MDQTIKQNVEFEVLTVVAMTSSVFWDITGLHDITFLREDRTLLTSPKVICCWCRHLVVIFNCVMVPSSRNHFINGMPLCCIICHFLIPHFLQCCHHAILSPENTLTSQKRATNINNFQEDVIYKTVLENDNKDQSQKSNTCSLGKNCL
jgi:hypothetical protein